MAGYTRQSSYSDGDTITAAHSNNEFDQVLAAFVNTSGHKHDGTAAEGPVIGLIGDPGETTPKNKVVVDNPNNQIEVSVDVSGTSTEQVVFKDGVIEPTTDNDIDRGSSGKEFKDLYIDGTAYVDAINFNGTAITSTAAELNILDGVTSTAAELNILDGVTSTAAELNILDGVTSTAAELNILDGVTSTAAELNILDGVTATAAELNLMDGGTSAGTTAVAGGDGLVTNDAGTMRQTTVDTFDTYFAATTKTLTNKTIDVDNNTVSNIEVDNLKSGVLDTDLSSVAGTDTTLASAKAIKAYVDAQVTASDLDFQGDSGGALSIDLDSETLDIAGGTGIDTSGSSNTLTVAIDSTVATLSGSQTLTNKTIDASQLSGTVANARLDQQLQDVAGLAVTNGNFIVGDGSNFVAESGSTARTSLGLGTAAVTDTGISSGNVATFTSGAADNDFLRIDGTAIEGRSAAEVLSDIGGQASLTFGISNTNAVKIDSASVADDEYARFTASGLESRSTAEVLSDIGGQASLTFGISNTNAVKIDSASVADDEYARFTANGLESRSTSEVISDIGAVTAADAANEATALAIALG